MRSNPPFDPRIQTIGINQNGPSTIHMPQMMINQMPPQQNFIQRPPMPQPMPNYIMQSPSPYPQHPIPTQFSNQQTRASRHQTGPQAGQQQSSKPGSVPVVQAEGYKTKSSQNHSQNQQQHYQEQGQQQYEQQYAGEEQQQIKNQQIIMFWEHKFYTILERFQLIFQKVQWIRSEFYGLNNQLKAVDSEQQWNQAKEHHEDFMEQLQQFSQELAGVINQNASLAQQNQNQHNQHNIWKDRYFQLFEGYKTMQQQLFSIKQGKSQDDDRNNDPKVSQILANYRQLQRQYSQVVNELTQLKQSKDQKIVDNSIDKTHRQKLDFAIRQAQKYKDTLDQLHKQNQEMAGIIQQLKAEKHNYQMMLQQNSQINHQKHYQQFTRAINERDQQINLLNKQLKQLSEKYNFLVQTHNSSQSRMQQDELRTKNKIGEIQQQAQIKNMEILQLKAKLHESELRQKTKNTSIDEYQRTIKLKANQIQQKSDQIQRLRKQIVAAATLRRNQSEKDISILRKQYQTKVKKIQDEYQQKIDALKKKLRKKQQEIQNTTLLNIKLESIQKKNKMLLQQIQSLTSQLHSRQKQSIELKRNSNIQQKIKELEYQYNITLQEKQRLNAALLQRNFDIETLQAQINQFQSRIRSISENSQSTSSKPLMYEIEQLTKLVQLKQNEINKLKANISLKEGSIRQLQNQVDRTKNTIITSQKHFSREKDILGENIRILQRKNQENQKRMRQIQFEYGSIMKKNLQDQIKTLRIQNQQRQQNIIRLQAQQLQLRSKISHYQRIRSTHGSDVQELTNRIKQLQTSKYDIIKKVQNSFRDVKNKQRQNRQLVDSAKTLKQNIIKLQHRISQNQKVLAQKQKIIQNLQGQILVSNSRLSYITQEHENLRLRRRDQTDLLTKQSQDLRRKIFQYEHLSGSRKQFKDKFSTEITKIQNQLIIQLKQQKQFLKSQLATALQQIGNLPNFDKKSQSGKKQPKSSQGIQYIQKRLFDFNNKLDQMIIKNKQISSRGFGSNIENSRISAKVENKQSQQQVKSLKAQILQLRKYISKLQVEIGGQTIRFNPKNQVIYMQQQKSYNERIQFYQKQTNQLQSRIQNLIQVNTSLKERVDALLKDGGTSSAISFYKNQLAISEQTVQNLHVKVRKLLQQNRSLKSNNNQVTTKMCRGYEDKIFECQNKIFVLERKISTYELEKNKSENERIDLQRNLNLAQTQLQSLKYSSEKQLETNKKNNRQLSDQVIKFESQIADLLQKVRILESQNSRLTQAVHANYSQQHIFMNTPVKDVTPKSSAYKR